MNRSGFRTSPEAGSHLGEPSTGTEATRSRHGAKDGPVAMSKIIVSVCGTLLTVGVALAALILTSANQTRLQFNEQIDILRQDIREVRGDVQEVRGDVQEVRGDVRVLAERVAKLEGFLLAGHRPGLVPPAEARGTDSSAARTGDAEAD